MTLKRYFALAASVIGLFFAALGCQSTPSVKRDKEAYEFAMRADNLFRLGRYDDAIAELEMGLKIEPSSALLVQQIGRVHFAKKNYDKALEYLNKSAKLEPNDPITHRILGGVYFYSKQPDAAIKSYLKAYELGPEDSFSILEVARCYDVLGDNKNAYSFFKKYLEIGDDREIKKYISGWMTKRSFEVPAFENLAASLLEERKFAELEAHLINLRDSKTINEDGDSQLTKAYEDALKVKNVRNFLETWQASHPNSSFAKSLLGAAYIDFAWEARGNGYIQSVTADAKQIYKERLAKAGKLLEEARILDPKNYETLRSLLAVHKAENATRKLTENIYATAAGLDPDNYGIHNEMMNMLMPKWGGTAAEMFEFARKVTKTSGDKSKAPLLVVLAHWEMAVQYYQPEPNKYFKSPEVWKESQEALELAVKRYPKSIDVKTLYVRTALAAGEIKTAQMHYKDIKGKVNLSHWYGYEELASVKRALASTSN